MAAKMSDGAAPSVSKRHAETFKKLSAAWSELGVTSSEIEKAMQELGGVSSLAEAPPGERDMLLVVLEDHFRSRHGY